MLDQNTKVAAFKALCSDKLAFLEDYGFRRTADSERCSSTMCSVVYLGTNIGFVFSLDIRDDCVDVRVARLHEGGLARSLECAYQIDLFDYLVRQRGYRGKPASARTDAGRQAVYPYEETLDGLIELLRTVGADLLTDDSSLLRHR